MSSARALHEQVRRWLDVVIVAALSAYLIIGVVVWGWLLLTDRPTPGGFTTVLSTIAGGLIGIVAPVGRGSDAAARETESRT